MNSLYRYRLIGILDVNGNNAQFVWQNYLLIMFYLSFDNICDLSFLCDTSSLVFETVEHLKINLTARVFISLDSVFLSRNAKHIATETWKNNSNFK